MKVILDIDAELLLDMRTHAEIVEEDLDVMLSNLFIRLVREPNEVIFEETMKDDCEEFENFHMHMINFLTITAHDPKNIAIQKVLIKLREHLTDMYIMTDLYRTYKSLSKL